MQGGVREGGLGHQHHFKVEMAAQKVKYLATATPSGGDRQTYHSVHALFICISWVTLVKLLNLSVPKFYHLQNRDYEGIYLVG